MSFQIEWTAFSTSSLIVIHPHHPLVLYQPNSADLRKETRNQRHLNRNRRPKRRRRRYELYLLIGTGLLIWGTRFRVVSLLPRRAFLPHRGGPYTKLHTLWRNHCFRQS